MSFLRDMVTRVFGEPVEGMQATVVVDPDDSTRIMHVNSDGSINTSISVVNDADAFAATATPTNVVASASSVQLLASNSSRKGMSVYNDGAANMYVNYGATASTSAFVAKVPANNLFEMPLPVYTGVVNAIWDSATGNARVLELT